MSNQPEMPCKKEESQFCSAKSGEEAMNVVIGQTIHHTAYQHYCKLDRALSKIVQKRWYLTKCSSLQMNDLQEPGKFGGQSKILQRTYIACFAHSTSEDVAMWGLYAKSDPLALRITIPGDTLESWMKSIEKQVGCAADRRLARELDIRGADSQRMPIHKQDCSVFRDLLYVAVAGDKTNRDKYDIRRGDSIRWDGACYKNDKEGVRELMSSEAYAGFIKDVEWSHERESRILIRTRTEKKDEHVSIRIPDDVIADMRFTFSPWLKLEDEKTMRNILEAALKGVGVDLTAKDFQRFRRSTLRGALNFR